MNQLWTWYTGGQEEPGDGEGVQNTDEPPVDYLTQRSQHSAFKIFLDVDSAADFVFHTPAAGRGKFSCRYVAIHPERLPSAIRWICFRQWCSIVRT